jgi:hypothetical protein
MAIRLPLKTVLSSTNTGEDGTNSVIGGIAVPFTIPQDTDNIVVKMQATTTGGGVSATFQTTDDGGTTWFDVAKTSVVSSATGVLAQWLSIPVINPGQRPFIAASQQNQGSTFGTIGNAAPSTLASRETTGLPILSQQARLFLQTQAGISGGTLWLTEVKVNSQSATA